MILDAMESMYSIGGSSKQSISDSMEQAYPGKLPPNHDALLSQSLHTLENNGIIARLGSGYRLVHPKKSELCKQLMEASNQADEIRANIAADLNDNREGQIALATAHGLLEAARIEVAKFQNNLKFYQ